jgi:transposase-like protein
MTGKLEPINLREKLKREQIAFDKRLAEVLRSRPDLTFAQICRQFSVSETVIRRVVRQFNIAARKPRSRRLPTR